MPRSTSSAVNASRMASGCRSSATGPHCSPRPSSATGCCSTRSPAIPVSSRSRCCLSIGQRMSTGPARSPPASAGSGWRGSSRQVAACRRNPLVRAAAATGRPLFVPIKGWGSSAAIGAATEGLGVPVVLTGSHYTTSVDGPRRRPAIRAPPPRHELDGPLARDRDRRSRALGAERILFGSGSPFRAIQSSINAILAAADPGRGEARDPGGNAARLLGLRRARQVELTDIVRPPRAIDVHTHSGPMPVGRPRPRGRRTR